MAVEVFEVLSVAMTSSPEVVRIKKFSLIFWVLGPTEFVSKKVYGPVLRLAELSSPGKAINIFDKGIIKGSNNE